jgi:putative transposase
VTVGYNEETVKRYIRNQLQEDRLSDQMSMKEFIDPFTGDKTK